jgi:glycosyltransferase involved in cell wall biosynthesis
VDVLESLRRAGVAPWSRETEIAYRIDRPAHVNGAPLFRPERPLVSCLMVTRGDTAILRYAVDSYARQTWRDRELVVVTASDQGEAIRAVLVERGVETASIFVVSPNLTLGDLRNLAVARAKGDILMQWDDDDLSDPQRIETSLAVLTQTGVAAAFLARILVWQPQRQRAAITNERFWEGTITVWRDHARVFPALPRQEDTPVMHALTANHPVARIDAPLLYVYAATGSNTTHISSFDHFVDTSACRFEGEAYRQLLQLLSARLPILDYEAELRRRAP